MKFKDPTPAFVLTAVGYLLVASMVGLAMMFSRIWEAAAGWDYYLIPSHAHLMLLGWVSMTIFGVAYRMFPALLGRRLHSPALAWLHFWLGNAALLGMAIFFFLSRLKGDAAWYAGLAISGILQFSAIVIFAYNLFRTALKPPPGYGITEL